MSSKNIGAFDEFESVELFNDRIYVLTLSKVFTYSKDSKSLAEIKITDMFRMSGDRIQKLIIDPAHPNMMFILDRYQLFFSSDSGESFKPLDIVSDSSIYAEIQDFVVCKNGVIVALAKGKVAQIQNCTGLFISENEGKTWKVMQKDVRFSEALLCDPNHSGNLFTYGTGLYALYDLGASYKYLGVPMPTAISFDKNNAEHIYVGTSCGILLESVHGNGSLKLVGNDDYPVTSIAISNNETYVAKNGIYFSKDLQNWEKLTSVGDYVATGKNTQNILIGVKDGGILVFNTKSKELTKLSEENVNSIAFDDVNQVAYLGTEHGIYKYDFLRKTLEHSGISDGIAIVAVDKSNPNIIYAALGTFKDGHAILRSVNGGKTRGFCDENILDIKDANDKLNLSGLEQPVSLFAEGNNIYVSIYPSFPGQQDMFINYNRLKGGLFVSNDFGKTWQYVNTMLNDKTLPLVHINSVFRFRDRTFIIVDNPPSFMCSHIEYSTDLKEWEPLKADLQSPYITSLFLDEEQVILYIGTLGGIYTVHIVGVD
ncbi:MAG: hypothetical protein ACP5QX_02825 [Caldisericaceae bacterium]